ncbi:MAG: DMT family transporter [Acidimicrobiales bacterium]
MTAIVLPVLAAGVLTALGASILFNLAPLAQAVEARRQPEPSGLGLGLLFKLAHRPMWLLGLACEFLGFGFEIVALSIAPLTLVEPLIGAGVVILAVAASRWLDESLGPAGGLALACTVAGGLAVVLSLRHQHQVGSLGTSRSLLGLSLIALVVSAGAVGLARWGMARRRSGVAGIGFGLVAGVCSTVSTLATRQMGLVIKHHGFFRVATMASVYVLIVFSILALAALQRGYQSGAVLVTFPVSTTLATALPVMAGIWLLGEPVPGGSGFWLLIVGNVLIVAGIAGLGRRRAVAGMLEAPAQPRGEETPAAARLPG